MDKNKLYRMIPKVDLLLEDEGIQELIRRYSRKTVMEAVHTETDRLRRYIGQCDEEEETALARIEALKDQIARTVTALHTPNMRMVINGTGTILHTNLGRAPIRREHMERAADLVSGYSNLEYNLEEGRRGERYSHFEKLLCRLTGAEAAMAVNNNAAAVMLILSSLAKGGEAVVSRGELVEIGGKFRIPDVMEQSGAVLVEVGTNKTHYQDYVDAITEETKVLLKVHTSNYRIVGFTETVGIDELISLAREHEIPIVEDLGSGVLIDLSRYGITYEPTVQDSIAKGADVVCFSGDKLLGGPQAGIIIGKKKYIDQMKKNQLTRALRIDKFTAAALELVLQEYLSEEKAVQRIPVLQMITKDYGEISREAGSLCRMLRRAGMPAKIETVACESQIGGGSLPLERLSSVAVGIRPEKISVAQLEERMRCLPVPIIPRTANDTILLDVRTIGRQNFKRIVEQLREYRLLEEDCQITSD